MFKLVAISKSYGGQKLFDELTWQVDRFRRTGLVGPNGSGKTTLLRILAGELAPDSGQLEKPRGATIGYLPQEVGAIDGESALAVVLEGRRDLLELGRTLESISLAMGSATDEARLEELTRAHDEAHERYEHLGGYQLVARAKQVLAGMGFTEADLLRPPSTFSGGWRVRLLLSQLLVQSPELLLLDEPTNHLDLATLGWLESFLHDYPGVVVLVSHDRAFLDRTVEAIAALEGKARLRVYAGDYGQYVRLRAEERALLEAKAEQQAKEVEKIEAFAERFRYKATKARQVQSRLNQLEKMERIELEPAKARTVGFSFPKPGRCAHQVIALRGVSKRYGDKVVYAGVDFTAYRGDRIALVGPNGAGKSTLLKLVAGVVPPDSGQRILGDRVLPGYFAQHQAESLDLELTVFGEMDRAASVESAPFVRGLLGAFLFSGDAVEKKVKVLSGGEKNRLALAKLLLEPPNLLVMDEPTNHLDLDSREALETALANYEGSLIFVSHDRYFINRLATKVIHVEGGKLVEYVGNYDEYDQKRKSELAAGTAGASGPAAPSADGASPALAQPATVNKKRELKRQLAELVDRRSQATRALREQISRAEAEIAKCEERVAEIDQDLADPATYGDGARVETLGRERASVAARLDPLMERWTEDQSRLEELMAKFASEERALTGEP